MFLMVLFQLLVWFCYVVCLGGKARTPIEGVKEAKKDRRKSQKEGQEEPGKPRNLNL